MRRLAALIVALSAACSRQVQVGAGGSAPAASRDAAITSADQLLAAMHARYAGKWYRNLTFIQGFEVYAQPPAKTLTQLRDEGFNVTLLRTDTLYSKGVYVVGAGRADSTSNQFWVEADRLLFVPLDENLFVPEKWTTATHWYKP